MWKCILLHIQWSGSRGTNGRWFWWFMPCNSFTQYTKRVSQIFNKRIRYFQIFWKLSMCFVLVHVEWLCIYRVYPALAIVFVYFCICVVVYLCDCVLVYLCTCVFVYLCISSSSWLQESFWPRPLFIAGTLLHQHGNHFCHYKGEGRKRPFS